MKVNVGALEAGVFALARLLDSTCSRRFAPAIPRSSPIIEVSNRSTSVPSLFWNIDGPSVGSTCPTSWSGTPVIDPPAALLSSSGIVRHALWSTTLGPMLPPNAYDTIAAATADGGQLDRVRSIARPMSTISAAPGPAPARQPAGLQGGPLGGRAIVSRRSPRGRPALASRHGRSAPTPVAPARRALKSPLVAHSTPQPWPLCSRASSRSSSAFPEAAQQTVQGLQAASGPGPQAPRPCAAAGHVDGAERSESRPDP